MVQLEQAPSKKVFSLCICTRGAHGHTVIGHSDRRYFVELWQALSVQGPFCATLLSVQGPVNLCFGAGLRETSAESVEDAAQWDHGACRLYGRRLARRCLTSARHMLN